MSATIVQRIKQEDSIIRMNLKYRHRWGIISPGRRSTNKRSSVFVPVSLLFSTAIVYTPMSCEEIIRRRYLHCSHGLLIQVDANEKQLCGALHQLSLERHIPVFFSLNGSEYMWKRHDPRYDRQLERYLPNEFCKEASHFHKLTNRQVAIRVSKLKKATRARWAAIRVCWRARWIGVYWHALTAKHMAMGGKAEKRDRAAYEAD